MSWYTYILQCADSSLYTGVTTDIKRRLHEHNHTNKAAKYTRVRRPLTLVYSEQCETRVQACKREWQIKRLARAQKLALIEQLNEQEA